MAPNGKPAARWLGLEASSLALRTPVRLICAFAATREVHLVLRVSMLAIHEELGNGAWRARYPLLDTTGVGATPTEAADDLAAQHAKRMEDDKSFRELVDTLTENPPPEWPVSYLTKAEFRESYRRYIQGDVTAGSDDFAGRGTATWQTWRDATAAVAISHGRDDLAQSATVSELQAAMRSLSELGAQVTEEVLQTIEHSSPDRSRAEGCR